MRILEWVLPILLLSLPFVASGADSTARRFLSVAEISFRSARLLPTSPYFRGEFTQEKPAAATFSGHLRYGFRFGPETFYGKRYPDAVQGIGVGYHTFFNPTEIGNPLSVYVFQTTPIFYITERISINYEWNFGVSYGWRKYDPETNPNNTVVGSKANAYINLGVLLDWRLNEQVSLKMGAGLSHFSNGNTVYPNAGVNTAGGYVGLVWNVCRQAARPRIQPEPDFQSHVSYDLVFYGSVRKKGFLWEDGSPFIVPGSFAVTGLNFAPMYNFSKYFRAGLSLDAQFDESANIADHVANAYASASDVKFHRPPFAEQFAVGLSARAEIVMPIFSINIGVGRNLLCKGPDTDSFYQIFALKTEITRNLFVHIGYQLYKFKSPNNLMLGLGYRLHTRQ